MHVVQTAAVPPRSGRTIFATIGWTEKRRAADSPSVSANRKGKATSRTAKAAAPHFEAAR
jgi:hypothetical protein